MKAFNAAGGINERMLNLVIENSMCKCSDAIAIYQQLAHQIIQDATCSGATPRLVPWPKKKA